MHALVIGIERPKNYMSLADRDRMLIRIESQIESKRRLLMEKKKILEKTSKENEFLKLVAKDYTKYYDAIKKEKENQIYTMNILNQYVKNVIKTGKLTESDIIKAKEDQDLLVKELGSIRKELDEILKK